MRHFRWDLVLAALVLALAILAHGAFLRYGALPSGAVLDRLTGRVCHHGACWREDRTRENFDAAWDSATGRR